MTSALTGQQQLPCKLAISSTYLDKYQTGYYKGNNSHSTFTESRCEYILTGCLIEDSEHFCQ